MIPWLLSLSLASAEPVPTPSTCSVGLRSARRPPAQPDRLASTTRPILVHYDANYDPRMSAMAAQVLAAAELSWDIQVDQMGFRPPELPELHDGPEYDIYLVEYARGTAFVAADNYQDAIQGDGYNSTSSYMVIDARLPRAWIDTYVAHEFNHACQWSTDFTEWSLPIWEGTATMAQTWTLGSAAAPWDMDVPDYQIAAAFPSLLADANITYYGAGIGYMYEYGSALWVKFLDEKYGNDDGALGVALWEATANEGFGMEPDVVDAFATVAGQPVGDALNHLALVRFLTGADWDPRGLADAAAWGPDKAVPAQPVRLAEQPLPWVDLPLAVQPFVTGHSFLDVDLTGGVVVDPADGEPWISVSVASPVAAESGLVVMWWDDAGQAGDASDWGPAPEVLLPAQGLTRVAIAVTHLGPAGWDGDDPAYRRGDFALSMQAFGVPAGAEPTTPTTPTTHTTPTPPDTSPTAPTEPDAPASKPSTEEAAGCGCASHGGPLTMGWLGAAGLVALRRRQRSRLSATL